MLALAGALAATSALGVTVSGRVFVDRNGDGVADGSEPGIARVAVSDGKNVVLTAENGDYRIDVEAGRPYVFVSLPRGYRAAKNFYVDSKPDAAANFALVEWPESRNDTVRFVQITDTHVTGDKETVRTFIDDIGEINALEPEATFVLATGDLVNSAKQANQFEGYLEGIAQFKLPLFNLPGNHDTEDATTAAGLENYHKYLGPDYYSFNVGGCHFVLLNCMPFDERDWIKRDLAAAPKGSTLVFAFHYLPTAAQMQYLAELGGKAVLSGHWHGNRVRESRGIIDMNTPPLRFGGIDRHPRSFRVVEIARGEVNNELRLGGFKHHGVIVAPAGVCVAAAGKLPVVVNAYDSRVDVAGIECDLRGQRVVLRKVGAWSWMGEVQVSPYEAGSHLLVAKIRATNGETWLAESTFRVQNGAAAANGPAPLLRLKWVASTGGLIGISSPRLGQNCIAVGVDDEGDLKNCGVAAFDRQGKTRWHFNTDSGIKNNIAATNGRLFATSVAGWLYALDETSGQLLWTAELDRQRERWEVAATTVADGVVYVGSYSYIAAFDEKTGKKLWETRLGTNDWWPSCYAIPTIAQGKVLLHTHYGAYALDARTGALAWKLDGKFNGCAVAGDTVYAVRNDVLAAVALESGKLLWTGKERIGDTASTPQFAGDKIVVGTADGRVCALSPKDGSVLWNFQTGASLSSLQPYQRGGSDVNSSPTIRGDVVYVGASDGQIYGISLAEGKLLGSYRLGVPIASSPVIAGDTLYIGGYDGNLYAFVAGR